MRLSFIAFIFLMLFTSRASADDRTECVSAHEEGQVARRDGHFNRAREAFALCQRDVCPAAVRSRCGEYARDLESAQPTVVVVVHDSAGADVSGARVSIDGAHPVDVSGMGLRLDPGKHTFAVTASGLLPAEKTITLSEGIKGMQAVISLEPPTHAGPLAATVPEQRSKPATAAWAFAAAGGVSLVTAGVLSGAGWMVRDHLSSTCGATGCSAEQVGTLRGVWQASFAALGVGVVSEAIALILFSTRSREASSSARLLAPATDGVRF
jgi:hypothetical protein